MFETMTLPRQGIADFPVGVDMKTLTSGFFEHDHDYVEINVIVRGTARHIVDGRPQAIHAGEAFVLNPGARHAFADTDNLVFYQAMFDPALLNPCLPVLKKMSGYHALFILEPASAAKPFRSRLSLDAKALQPIVMLFEEMIGELADQREGWQALVQAGLIRLVTALCRLHGSEGRANPGIIHRIARTAAHIEENYLQPLSLTGLAEVSGCSVSQLIRDFKRSYGATPASYILHLRLEHAIQLLKDKNLTVTEAAYASGFSDSNYFSRLFRQKTGLTPGQYRERV